MKAHKFCPFCGKRNHPLAGTPHRRCPACGEHDWRNPAPAVGVALLRGGKVLLSMRARAPRQGEWDLVGGFIEADETPEQAAAREVEEETGCTPTHLAAHEVVAGDYDGLPTLNFLFTAELVGEPEAHDDSALLKWWPRGKVPPIAWPHEAAFVRSLGVAAAKPARTRAKRRASG